MDSLGSECVWCVCAYVCNNINYRAREHKFERVLEGHGRSWKREEWE